MVNTVPTTIRYGRAPTVPLELANKAYVDSLVLSGNTFARVVKKVDQTVNSSTTVEDDNELKVALLASKTYGYQLILFIDCDTTTDFKYSFTIPSGATGLKSNSTYNGGSPASTADITADLGMSTDGNIQNLFITGRVIMSTTPGDLQLQWAQNTSGVADSKVLEGSYLIVWEELA